MPGRQTLLMQFDDLFNTNTVGLIRGHKGHLYFKNGAQFWLYRPLPLPLAHKPRDEKELTRLVSMGFLTPADKAEYSTTQLVAVPKPNGGVRLCGDLKVSLNKHFSVQQYPLLTVADVLQTAAGGTQFLKRDLAYAYLQVEFDVESRRYVVFTTHKGLYQVNRLAVGLAAAPAIFQSIIKQIILPVPRAHFYLDDVLFIGFNKRRTLGRSTQVFREITSCRKQTLTW